MSDLFEGRGGFNFELQKRNAKLAEKGYTGKKATKTGTTIVGLICHREKAVVLAADSRATFDNIVATKDCIKIHYIAPNIYCCGAGTAADTDNATLLCSEKLELLRLNSGCQSRVKTANTILTQHLFRYMGHISAALILGGVDINGPQLFTIHPHGSSSVSSFTTMGSGSLAAMSVFESRYNTDLTLEECKQLAHDAICAGIFNDMGSGSLVNLTVIKSDGSVEHFRPYDTPVGPRKFVNPDNIQYTPGMTPILSKKFTPHDIKLDVQIIKTPEIGEDVKMDD